MKRTLSPLVAFNFGLCVAVLSLDAVDKTDDLYLRSLRLVYFVGDLLRDLTGDALCFFGEDDLRLGLPLLCCFCLVFGLGERDGDAPFLLYLYI